MHLNIYNLIMLHARFVIDFFSFFIESWISISEININVIQVIKMKQYKKVLLNISKYILL